MNRWRLAMQVPAFVISLAVATWGFLPVGRERRIQALPQPILGADRRLVLDAPERIRLGDTETLSLTLEVSPLTGPVNAAPRTSELGLLSEAPTRVIVAARLDASLVEVRPSDVTSEPLVGAESVTFYWTVRGTHVGQHTGTLWVHLRDTSNALSGASQQPISALPMEMPVVGFFGLSGALARAAGTIGLVATGVHTSVLCQNRRRQPA